MSNYRKIFVNTKSCSAFCRICFTIVSEPPEDLEDGECEDVGVSYVSIRDILKNNKDLINADVPSMYHYLFLMWEFVVKIFQRFPVILLIV